MTIVKPADFFSDPLGALKSSFFPLRYLFVFQRLPSLFEKVCNQGVTQLV